MAHFDGFRSKAGWPFTAEIALKYSEEDQNWKLEFDFGDDGADSGEIVEFSDAPFGQLPQVRQPRARTRQQLCAAKLCPRTRKPRPSCDFKSGKIILQQPVEREQMTKLLSEGKTDLLDKFVSMRTRRAFKAFCNGMPKRAR